MTQRIRPTKRQSSAPEPATASVNEYQFARFWRCALQVNPSEYQAKYRGQDHGHDEDSYSRALLEKCRKLEIRGALDLRHGFMPKVFDALPQGPELHHSQPGQGQIRDQNPEERRKKAAAEAPLRDALHALIPRKENRAVQSSFPTVRTCPPTPLA